MSTLNMPDASSHEMIVGAQVHDPRVDTKSRDTFLLAKLLPTSDSPKLCGMIYDAVVDELGMPGVGYDPVGLFRCSQRHWSILYPLLAAAERSGFQAAKDAGWY